MYIYIKIWGRVFTFGSDREGVERRKADMPVPDEHRVDGDRRGKEAASGKVIDIKVEK